MSKGESFALPQQIKKQKPTLALFITYLKQHSTKDALLGLASKKDRLKEFSNYLHTLTINVGSIKDEEDLQRLVEQTPALYEVVNLARSLGTAIIPTSAMPSESCMEALLKCYHKWVKHQAQGE